MKALLKQFNIGAINGFLFGFSSALIFSLAVNLILYFKLHLSISYFKYVGMMHTNFLKASLVPLFFAGLAKIISHFVFKKHKNIFTEWQRVGLITLILLYLFVLVENTIDFLTIPGTFNGIFVESLDLATWLIILVLLSLYNLAFAFILRFIES